MRHGLYFFLFIQNEAIMLDLIEKLVLFVSIILQ
jgi:hypothetical protein